MTRDVRKRNCVEGHKQLREFVVERTLVRSGGMSSALRRGLAGLRQDLLVQGPRQEEVMAGQFIQKVRHRSSSDRSDSR